jgi:putative transposase
VQLVISDHHLGIEAAIASVFIGASWQRCKVHFTRNVLSKVPKASSEMVAAAIRTIFAQPDPTHVRAQLDEVTRMLSGQFADAAAMLADAPRTSSPSEPSPRPIAARSDPPSTSNGSTARSSGAPTS